MRATRLAVLAFPALAPAAGAMAQNPPAIAPGNITVGLRTVANLANYPTPIDLTHANDASRRIFIATQNGHVFVHQNGAVNFGQPFLNISSNSGSGIPLQYGGEMGLLGMAFHPDFATQGAAGFGKFYTYTSEAKVGNADFTHPEIGAAGGDHQSVIREWTVSPTTPGRVDTSVPSRVLMRIAQPQDNHNGGSIKFAPDESLFIAMGDGGGGNDHGGSPTNNTDGHSNNTGNGQDLSVVYGKILRIDPLGTNGKTGQYGVPTDNPFATSNAHDTKMIFASGMRNPFRASFDRVTGKYYVGDVGQGNREEVDIVESGKNYGWVYMEGTRVNRTPPVGAGPFTPPVAEYLNRGVGGDGNAVIGGFVYRGTKVPDLYGKYVFGDFQGTTGTGRLFYTDAGGGTINELTYFSSTTANVGTPSGQLYSFGEDEGGELYTTFTGGQVRILLAQAWGKDGGGSWGTATNWIGPVPNGAGHVANFLTELVTPANAPATITLDGNKTVGTLRFNNTVTNGVNPNSYTITQGTGGTLSILGGGGTPASIEVLAGTHTIAAPLRLSTSTINIADGSLLNVTSNVDFMVGALHTITKTGGGVVNVAQPLDLSGQTLQINGGTFSVPGYLTRGNITVNEGATLLAGQVALDTLTVRGTADVERIADDGSPTRFTTVGVHGPDAANPATLRTSGIRADQLSITHGKVTITPGGANVNTTVVSGLNMTQEGSTLDLNDNDLVVHAGAGGPTYHAGMLGWIQRARNSELGRWKGPGLTSSAAAENPLTGLALVLNTEIVDGVARPIFSTFSGEPTAIDDVLVKYTYNGDANLDGRINSDDYFRIDSGFLGGGGGGGWRNGDFNYDGRINSDDYFLIDSAFLGQGAPLDGGGVAGALQSVVVPEPVSLALALAPLLLLRRRRRA